MASVVRWYLRNVVDGGRNENRLQKEEITVSVTERYGSRKILQSSCNTNSNKYQTPLQVECQTSRVRLIIKGTYDSKIDTPMRESRRRNGVRVVPRISNDLANVKIQTSSAMGQPLTNIAVTKNKMLVIGEPGQ